MRFGGASPFRAGRRFAVAAGARARLGGLLAAALAVAVLVPATALAAIAAPSDGGLSPRLAALDAPSLRGADPAEQAEALSLPADGPGSLLREGRRLLAYVRFDSGALAGEAALREAGAEIVAGGGRYQTVTVAAPAAVLSHLADVSGVEGVTEALAPILRATCAGAVRSEGDAQLEAAQAREDFAVDGSGVTVGILSDSFDRDATATTHAGGDVTSGDLPGPGSSCGSSPVGVLDDSEAGGDDEGRAMAQIVHDLAPGAALDFATAFKGELGFAENVRRLAKAGAKVIADDVAYLEEPFFQDGPVADAIGEAVGSGVSYFSAAGNDNVIFNGHNVGSWEASAFRDTACPLSLKAAAPEVNQCMNFRPGAGAPDSSFGISVGAEQTLTLDLQWAEPWNGVRTDLDAYLLNALGEPISEGEDAEGKPILVGSYGNNIASQKPVEVMKWRNPANSPVEVNVAISHCSGTCNETASPAGLPRLKFALLKNSGVRPASAQLTISEGGDTLGPTVFGHAGSTNTIAVGAVRYSDASKPESYSSRGPVKHLFGPVTGATAAAPIAAQEISKPDLVASDCNATTFFAQKDAGGTWRFCGTSAAAPHAAAVAALIRQANPNASAAQLRAALTATTNRISGFGVNDVGAGLIDAGAAVAALALAPTVTVTKAPEPLSRNRRPLIEFKANRPATFSCALDGGPPQICSSPYTLPLALSDGVHGIAVTAVDRAGRTANSNVASFRVDTRAPRTRIAKHPRKVIRTHRRSVRLGFRFRANEPETIFVCKVDRGLLRFCGANFSRRFAAGKHVVTVRARDAAGNVQRKASVFHFKVMRVGHGR
ncbi:MAG: S8 family serine peptidase [Solirubrobacterales bacterium]